MEKTVDKQHTSSFALHQSQQPGLCRLSSPRLDYNHIKRGDHSQAPTTLLCLLSSDCSKTVPTNDKTHKLPGGAECPACHTTVRPEEKSPVTWSQKIKQRAGARRNRRSIQVSLNKPLSALQFPAWLIPDSKLCSTAKVSSGLFISIKLVK